MHYVRTYNYNVSFYYVTVAIRKHTYVTVTIQVYITTFVRFNFHPGYIYAWVSVYIEL